MLLTVERAWKILSNRRSHLMPQYANASTQGTTTLLGLTVQLFFLCYGRLWSDPVGPSKCGCMG